MDRLLPCPLVSTPLPCSSPLCSSLAPPPQERPAQSFPLPPPLPVPLQVNYKLRDWLFARQRYWGEPFPLLLVTAPDGETEEVVAVAEEELPVTLPEMDDFTPTGEGGRTSAWILGTVSPTRCALGLLHWGLSGRTLEWPHTLALHE